MPYNPYMQGNPGMMMNGNQMYNPNMIAYRMPMPPPPGPNDANKTEDGKSRDKPPHQPPYPPQMYWPNHYMMQHAAMRANN